MNYDTEGLKAWVPSWKGGTFFCEAGTSSYSVRSKYLRLIPDGKCGTSRIDKPYRGQFTYCPDGYLDGNVRSIGQWGGIEEQQSPWWQGWSLVGHGVLIRVSRDPNAPLGPTILEDGYNFYTGPSFSFECEYPYTKAEEVDDCQQCWMFAFVDSWCADTQTHRLIFRENNVYYNIDANLHKCIFQEWTRPCIRSLPSAQM